MEDFRFQPWERLSDEVTDGQAHARREMNGREWLFRRCGRLMFVRDAKHAPLEWNRWLFFPPMWNSASSDDPEQWEWNRLAYMMKRKNIWRVWRLSDDEPTVALWNEEAGWKATPDFPEFTRGRGYQRPCAPFHLPYERDVETTPSSLLFVPLLEEWNEMNSDLRFSAHFASLSLLEQNLSGVETRCGTPQEFASVLQLALRAFDFSWDDEDEEGSSVALHATRNQGRFVLEKELPLGTRESAILNHIMRAYKPSLKPDSPDLPSAVRPFTNYGVSRSFSIGIERPTRHQQLEAALELRAWLETYWPDGVKHLEEVV